MSEKAQILDLAAQSNVTISALDARGLHAAQMGAGERGASSTMAMVTGYDSQSHSDSVTFILHYHDPVCDQSGGSLSGRFEFTCGFNPWP